MQPRGVLSSPPDFEGLVWLVMGTRVPKLTKHCALRLPVMLRLPVI